MFVRDHQEWDLFEKVVNKKGSDDNDGICVETKQNENRKRFLLLF